jgi:hypothetical protein
MASGENNPIADYNPPLIAFRTAWDVVLISGVTCPGYCEISGFERGWGWDVKEGKGAQGTTPTYTNKQRCEGEIVFYLWTAQDFIDWEGFRPLFLYDPTKSNTPQAVSIEHPSLADIGIKSVVTQKISPIRHLGNQLYSCTVKLLEYAPPPPANAVASPTGTKPDATLQNSEAPAPTDPLQQKIADLLKQLDGP